MSDSDSSETPKRVSDSAEGNMVDVVMTGTFLLRSITMVTRLLGTAVVSGVICSETKLLVTVYRDETGTGGEISIQECLRVCRFPCVGRVLR
jgi:hypothetical protein